MLENVKCRTCMEQYIQISKINDFLYCPMSLYLHSVYENFTEKTYHQTPQVVGKIKHKAIDEDTYSSSKRFLVGASVWSEEYGIMGKIDIYDRNTFTLIERKTRVKKIYKGYVYQLYAQYFAMKEEMRYKIKKLVIRSLDDNKHYPISLPSKAEKEEFGKLIKEIKSFSIHDIKNHSCPKCVGSIYGTLSW